MARASRAIEADHCRASRTGRQIESKRVAPDIDKIGRFIRALNVAPNIDMAKQRLRAARLTTPLYPVAVDRLNQIGANINFTLAVGDLLF